MISIPIEAVDLYYIPNHQFANRQYFIGTKTSFKLGTVNGVKCTGNMMQTIKLPYSASFETFNMVGIDGKFYDVLSVDSSTQDGKTYSIQIALNPVVSFISTGANISGYWERTPTLQNPSANISIGDDRLYVSRKVYLPKISSVWGNGDKPMYVEICAKRDLDIGEGDDSIAFYGMWVPAYSFLLSYPSAGWYFAHNATTDCLYPTLKDLIYNLVDITGLPSASILSVSISPRCPWRYAQYKPGSLAEYAAFGLKKSDGTYITRKQFATGWCYNRIDGSYCAVSDDVATARTLTLTEFERYCGRISLVDERNNEVAVIPNEYFNSSHQLTYYCYAQSDISGIYTMFRYGDVVNIMPEGSLPWLGDSWADYLITNQNYDRQELSRNVSSVKEQRNIDMINAVGNGLMTSAVGAMANPAGAALGVAQMGLGIVTSEMSANLSIKNLQASQANKEGLIKASPTSNYSMGYGINYINQSLLGGAYIKVETPKSLSSSDYENYIAYRGWPCNKYATITPSTGYLKGILYSVPVSGSTPLGNGTEIDALRREIAEGIRIVTA